MTKGKYQPMNEHINKSISPLKNLLHMLQNVNTFRQQQPTCYLYITSSLYAEHIDVKSLANQNSMQYQRPRECQKDKG